MAPSDAMHRSLSLRDIPTNRFTRISVTRFAFGITLVYGCYVVLYTLCKSRRGRSTDPLRKLNCLVYGCSGFERLLRRDRVCFLLRMPLHTGPFIVLHLAFPSNAICRETTAAS